MRVLKMLFVGWLLSLAVVGCGEGEQAQPTTAGEQTSAQGRQTTAEADDGGEVVVGGFSVEGLGDVPETTVPQVSVEREAAREYLNQVRPIVEDTAREVSDLVEPEARMENGRLEVDVGVGSLKEAREDVRSGLERLREVQPPEGLEPINDRLISAYEEVLPAYDSVIEAAESGDPDRVREAIQQGLPRIERFNDLTKGIVQDLEQAAGTV